jgi:hypothetical protein
MKKITIGSKPTSKSRRTSPDDWVSDRSSSDERMKRLTIDIPESLHQRVKSQCALNGEKMADVVRALLEKQFKPAIPPVVQASEPFATTSEHVVGANDLVVTTSEPVVTTSEPVTEIHKDDSVTISNYDGDHTGT